jgi:hypothetical protein
MRICILLFVIILFSLNVFCQELQWFGPRAGVGILSDSGKSDMKKGIHSAFGWQIELPYSNGDLIGYGEAGLMFIGIEQGKVYPHVWGYFGCRYKEIGGGLGPVFNPIGTGLGINMYYNLLLEKLRVPIGIDLNFIGGTSRIVFFIGFNYK